MRTGLIAGIVSVAFVGAAALADDKGDGKKKDPATADRAAVDEQIASWPARPRLAAAQMMEKYGVPREVSSEALVWHDADQYKRIMVTKKEVPHDFPKPHMDYLEHTIAYDVPADMVDDLVAFDASITVNKTAGEMSARCDLEGHNILTHNLSHDIVTGKKTVTEAREAFGQIVVEDVMGEHPPYVEKLQFDVATSGTMFPDKPIIAGSPRRAVKKDSKAGGGDAETLAMLIAADENEVLAAAAAATETVDKKVLDYAKMMHTGHGAHAAATMKLGLELKVTPIDTAAVDKLRVKGASELAKLVPLAGDAFGVAYMDAMIAGHTEVLAMLDDQLRAGTENAALKKHLTKTRKTVAAHLASAKKIAADL